MEDGGGRKGTVEEGGGGGGGKRTVDEGRGRWRREGDGGGEKGTVEERRGQWRREGDGGVVEEGWWRGDGVGRDSGGGGRDGGGGGRDQGCIFSPKDESRGVEEIMGTFEEPKGDPWISGKNIGKSQFWVGKNIGSPGRIYIPGLQDT